MKPARFLREAQEEFLEQVSYYEGQQEGLGDHFRESVEAATALASAPQVTRDDPAQLDAEALRDR